jgi:hypothetical protein
MYPNSVNRFPLKHSSAAPRLFLVPRTGLPAEHSRGYFSVVTRRNISYAFTGLTLFWSAHLILERVFHL